MRFYSAIIALFILSIAYSPIHAQTSPSTKTRINLGRDVASIAIGTGLDYGGSAGIKLNMQVAHNFSIFLASGLWASRITTAIGAKIRLLAQPQSMFSPHLMGVYGNTYIQNYEYYTGRAIFKKGLAAGAGFDLLNTPNSFGYLSFGALYAPTPNIIYISFGLNAVIGRRPPLASSKS